MSFNFDIFQHNTDITTTPLGICPLCMKTRTNDTALSISGYVCLIFPATIGRVIVKVPGTIKVYQEYCLSFYVPQSNGTF